MITIEEIKAAIDANKFPLSGDVIKTGTLQASDGRNVNFDFYLGWDLVKCRACDREWGAYNLELSEFIKDQNYDKATLSAVLDTIQMDDSHWDWLVKGGYYRQAEYRWFFLMADGKQQAACLIYHPKKNAEGDKDIFYIEYLAVAPWNRGNPMQSKVFKGIGTMVIQSIIEFAITKLGFQHGFSLHALPRASGFYTKIGMQRYPHLDKDGLRYFEMKEKVSNAYMGGA